MINLIKYLGSNSTDTIDTLKYAVLNNDVELTKSLLKEGIDATQETKFGSLLKSSISRNNLEMVQLLLQYGACLKTEEKNDYTRLYCALAKNDTPQALLLLKEDVQVDPKNTYPLLLTAAKNNNLELLGHLIEKGFDVDSELKFSSDTLLSFAIKSKNIELAKFLLEKGANVNKKNSGSSHNLLNVAIITEQLESVKLLIEKGANVKCSKWDGRLVLIAENKNLDILQFLIDRGANLDYDSLAISAIQNKNLKLLKFLIEKGININKRGRCQNTLLHAAVIKNDYKLVKLLVNNGADLNAKNSEGYSPIDCANNDGYFSINCANKKENLAILCLLKKAAQDQSRKKSNLTTLRRRRGIMGGYSPDLLKKLDLPIVPHKKNKVRNSSARLSIRNYSSKDNLLKKMKVC